MDTSTLVGTGFVVLGRGRLDRLRRSTPTRTRPRFGRSAWLWAILAIIFGPLALMVLYVLPKQRTGPPRAAGAGEALGRRTRCTRSRKKKH